MLGARGLKTSSTTHKNPSFERPGPPPLPAKEQREFEKLIKEKQSECEQRQRIRCVDLDADVKCASLADLSPFSANASMDSEELHPDMRRKPDPDFDGETNPMTGEVGGPKKDPLAWQREWTYGGRATDF